MTKHENELSNMIIGLAIEVHRHLGPGLLESAYEECLCREFSIHKVKKLVIIELKAVEKIEPINQAHLLTYLRLLNLKLGLIIDFNVPILKDGIKRIVILLFAFIASLRFNFLAKKYKRLPVIL